MNLKRKTFNRKTGPIKSFKEFDDIIGAEAQKITVFWKEVNMPNNTWTKPQQEYLDGMENRLRSEIQDVRTEIAEVRTELKADIKEVRAEIKATEDRLRTEMQNGFALIMDVFKKNKMI